MSTQLAHTKTYRTNKLIRILRKVLSLEKCRSCGCMHESMEAITQALQQDGISTELEMLLQSVKDRLVPVQYDCLGCKKCYSALVVNAAESANSNLILGSVCAADTVERRETWPPFPGAYTVLCYEAPVAICSLTDDTLVNLIADSGMEGVSIAGTLYTENLGIERIIQNILANPHIRFLIVCGPDSYRDIGHLPGQSLIALARWGVNEQMRIVKARGKRPVLCNLTKDTIEYFRRNVEIIDLTGISELSAITGAVKDCIQRNPGTMPPFTHEGQVQQIAGYLPLQVVNDPAGYFVIYVDRPGKLLSLEHYGNNGTLDMVIKGKNAAELYIPAIERGLVSRLDHAAYIGRELARAEEALMTGNEYIQDAAPEQFKSAAESACCGCSSSCVGEDHEKIHI